jgi:CRP/FNR family cyclic AMP-dependent transcriptional regulator
MSDGVLEKRRRLLQRVPLFSRLELPQLDALCGVTRIRHLEPKEELFHKGDPGAEVYGIVTGKLKVGSSSADGGNVVFNLMGEGEVVGEMAFLTGGQRTGTVSALEPTELLALGRRDFLEFLRANPEVAIDMMAVLAERLANVSQLLEDRSFLDLPARLAKKLVLLCEQYGESHDDDTTLSVTLSQTDLGNLVGTSRESINKQVRSWEQQGILDMKRGHITIHRLGTLKRLAGLLVD